MRVFYYVIMVLYLTIGIPFGLLASRITYGRNTYTEIELSRAHIRLSNEAEELIKTARKSETEQQWATAVKNYQKALEIYSPYVINQSILSNTVNNSNNDLYWGVQYICEKSLQNLPPEGKKIYSEIFEPIAKHLFESSYKIDRASSKLQFLDINKLSLLAEHYSLTSYGQLSLIVLIRWHLERSELYQAIRYYRKLLVISPESAGALPEGKIIYNFLNKKDTTQTELWQTYAGNNTRSQIMTSTKEIFPSLFGSFELPTQLIKRSQIPIDFSMGYYGITPVESIPSFPVVSDGLVYLSTGAGIYVLELEPKEKVQSAKEISSVDEASSTAGRIPYKLKEKWKFEIPFDENIQVFSEERTINTATVVKNSRRLYVPLITSFEKHERRLGYLDVKYPFPRWTLFAFDTLTDRILWTTQKTPYDNRDNNSFEDILFPIAPVAENDVLYLAGIHMPHQTDIPEHYLFVLNAKNGEVYFKTFIASGILETNLFNNPSREPVASAVTVDKDNIYYCSQMGVIAAVDKYSGILKWLKKYEQYSIPPTYPDPYPPRLPLRWINNPIIYTDSLSVTKTKGQIIVTAIDSPFLYVLSTENGEELWRWNGDIAQIGNIRYLIGVKDNLLIVSSESSVICLNLAKDGKIEWIKDGYKFVGKGAITDDKVYISTIGIFSKSVSPNAPETIIEGKTSISTNNAILEIGLKTGKLLNIHTDSLGEKIQAAAGHLFFIGDFLVTISLNQMKVYKQVK